MPCGTLSASPIETRGFIALNMVTLEPLLGMVWSSFEIGLSMYFSRIAVAENCRAVLPFILCTLEVLTAAFKSRESLYPTAYSF